MKLFPFFSALLLLAATKGLGSFGRRPGNPGTRPARAARRNVVSPRFNDNYLIKTRSFDERYTVVSTPFFCTNENEGCVKVLDNATHKTLYEFKVSRLIGCVYVATNEANLIVKVPTGIGLSPVVVIGKESREENIYVKIYRSSAVRDSIRIPSVSPTLANKRYFFTGRQLDRSKVLHIKADTLAIVTCRGLALLAYHAGLVTATFTPAYARLKSFKPLVLDAHVECFPYPQPTSCAEVDASTPVRRKNNRTRK